MNRTGTSRSSTLVIIRVLLGIIFATYGVVKVLGGQYFYGDWVLDKKTVDGTSLVWAFFGYSRFYGRFTGLFELVPALLLLIPRTATIGAAALFAVSLNITAMDFAYGYPAVKYFALLYTALLAVLLWADRQKLQLLLEDTERARAALALVSTSPATAESRVPMGPTARRLLVVLGGVLVLAAINILAISVSDGPEVAAARSLARQGQPGERIQLLHFRLAGLIGLNWTARMDFVVVRRNSTDTVTVRARKVTGFLPWRVEQAGPAGRDR